MTTIELTDDHRPMVSARQPYRKLCLAFVALVSLVFLGGATPQQSFIHLAPAMTITREDAR